MFKGLIVNVTKRSNEMALWNRIQLKVIQRSLESDCITNCADGFHSGVHNARAAIHKIKVITM